MSLEEIEVTERAADEFIVDTDFHAGPSTDLSPLIPYVRDDLVKQKLEINSTLSAPSGVKPYWATDDTLGYHSHGAAMDGETVGEVMDRYGIDVALLAPGTNTLPMVQYPRMKVEICRAVNDYFLDEIVPARDGIKAHMALPVWEPDACLRELDRIGGERDIVGAYAWYNPYSPLMGEPRYDPVYERLIDLDLPLVLHVGGGTYPPMDRVVGSVRTRTETISVFNTFYAIADLVNMIVTGVFDKYPDLRVVCQEAGVGWIPFVANRITEVYHTQPEDIKLTERMAGMGKEYLDKDPGEYIYDCYYSTQPIALPKRGDDTAAMLQLCRAGETFMYSSDWPHHTLDPVNWVFDAPIDGETRDAILHGNATECYGL